MILNSIKARNNLRNQILYTQVMSDVVDPDWLKDVEVKVKKDATKFFDITEMKKNQFQGKGKFCGVKMASTGNTRYKSKL